MGVKKTRTKWEPKLKPRKPGDAAEFVKRSFRSSHKAMKKLR